MGKLIILRGLPGSGKSTFASVLEKAGAEICSTDSFFYRDGKYDFSPGDLSTAHAANQHKVETLMHYDKEVIVVDNTNIRREWFSVYLEMAYRNEYEVTEVIVGRPLDPSHVEDCIKRNSHWVPPGTIRKHSEMFEM